MNYIDTQDLNKYSIKAQDGEIGKVNDFYFDEDLFYLRYLVVNTEPFLLRNLVLVSPVSFHKINPSDETVDVYVTKKEFENSPPLESAETISRQYEKVYNDYFSWPYYWGTMGTSAWAIGPYGIPWNYYDHVGKEAMQVENRNKLIEEAKENNLRSAKEVQSYSIKGADDEFGHIQGFLLDPKTLSIDFIIVDTINYLPSKLVLLRPEWIQDISWYKKTVSFPFFKELIKSAPAYKKDKLNKEFIKECDDHFKEANKLSHDESKSNVKVNRDKLVEIPEKQKAVGDIPSGIFVVTVENQETHKPVGFLASWVQQASFDPLLVSICIKDGRPGIDEVLKKSPFCINVVGDDNAEYLSYFTKDKAKKMNPLDKIAYKSIKGKGAILDKAKSAMICEAYEVSHPGDHYLVTAKVTEGMVMDRQSSSMTRQRESGTHY